MDFNITAEEGTLVRHIAWRLASGDAPTDDDLADELGDEVRPQLQTLLEKGWLVVDDQRSLRLSRIARAVISA